MLAGLSFVPGLKEALTKYNYEYKEIALKDKELSSKHQRMTRGKTKYNNVEELINEFGSEKIKSRVPRYLSTLWLYQKCYIICPIE
ncbi:hypothetical protein [Bacillus pacificus]|uniref:hypothetical protein n=1 Tax=Bacillus pacificus TaxID=2026187 RepID=UPI003731126A